LYPKSEKIIQNDLISYDKTCLCEAEDLSWASNDAGIVFNDGNSGRINRTAGTSCDETQLQAFLET